MLLHLRCILLLQWLGEIALQLLGQVGIFRNVGIQQLLEGHQLGIRQQHRQFRPGQALPARLALGQFRIRRQELDLPVQQALRFQGLDEVLLGTQARHAHAFHHADRLVLAVVVPQHQVGHFIGHRGQQLVASFEAQLLGLHHAIEQDLDVDFMVRRVHAGRVVDEVGIEQHAMLCGFDTAQLGQAQVAALAHHLATQLLAVDAQRIVGAITGVGVLFAAGLDVDANATVPQQVDRRLQDGAHQLVR